MTRVLGYPLEWQGQLRVTNLTMVGDRLYTANRGLYSTPLATGSAWEPVRELNGQGFDALATDGQRLFVGDRAGKVQGYDPQAHLQGDLATVGSAVTGLAVTSGALLVGTAERGVCRVPIGGGPAMFLASDDPAARKVTDLVEVDGTAYGLASDRLWAWPMGSSARALPQSDGATALTSWKGTVYLGTADGWLMRTCDGGRSLEALGHAANGPIHALGTDGSWLYAASGNTTYMQDLRTYAISLCHTGFPGVVDHLVVLDGERVLVGTEQGLYWMRR